MSRIFTQTFRQAPADAEVASHQLLVRAGFIQPLAAGVFTTLPLARRALDKIEAILRQEIDAIGGQEMTMPVVHPAELWKQTRRWYKIGSELARFQDKSGRDMVLAMTHEEVVADLAHREIQSYRQLPQLIYHIQTKWRDDPRPRAGLIRAREFTMLDSYSLDLDAEGLERQYRAHYQAYFNIFHRCGLSAVAVQADVGIMGGSLAHEFMLLTGIGEDTLILCDRCGYTANRQVARFAKPAGPAAEGLLPVEKVATPGAATIAELAAFLGIPTSRTAKAVFLIASTADGDERRERFVFALVRGDMDVNETKLLNAVGALDLRPAREDEIRAVGATPGYASPIGLPERQRQAALVVADDALAASANLVAGANEAGYHLRNVNLGRDFQADILADIATAAAGDACVVCGGPLRSERGVEMGNIFQLGTSFSEALGATVLDKDGKVRPIVMGSYGIGVGRLLACVAEQHHDEAGLIWPVTVAPYPVHIVALAGGDEAAAEIYSALQRVGMGALFDDRDESPGVKFADADLIGLPLRLTVGRRSLGRGGAELRIRRTGETMIVGLDEVPARAEAVIASMEDEIRKAVTAVPYREPVAYVVTQ
jgi:prolyl-tRNA synthetase